MEGPTVHRLKISQLAFPAMKKYNTFRLKIEILILILVNYRTNHQVYKISKKEYSNSSAVWTWGKLILWLSSYKRKNTSQSSDSLNYTTKTTTAAGKSHLIFTHLTIYMDLRLEGILAAFIHSLVFEVIYRTNFRCIMAKSVIKLNWKNHFWWFSHVNLFL